MTSQAPAIVVDTNVVSYIERKSPIADYYLSYLVGRRVVVSFQTVEEALFGAYRDNWGRRV